MVGTSGGGKKSAEKRGRDNLSEAGKKGAQSVSHETRLESARKAAKTRALSKMGRTNLENQKKDEFQYEN